MNISLTKELEQMVNQKVESGMYSSASEVVRDGLRLLKKKDMGFEAAVQEGIDACERGDYQEYTPEGLRQLFQEISREGRERLRKGRQ